MQDVGGKLKLKLQPRVNGADNAEPVQRVDAHVEESNLDLIALLQI